jgi:hypothetical protein
MLIRATKPKTQAEAKREKKLRWRRKEETHKRKSKRK